MKSAITNWDYFELYPLTRLARGHWMRLFIERPDGDWNFHPRGFGEPGYRVNGAERVRLQRTSFWVRTPFEYLLVLTGIIFSFQDFSSYSFQCLRITTSLAALAYFAWVGWTGRHDALEMLARSPEVVKPLSIFERQRRNVGEWCATPSTAKFCTFILVGLFTAGSLANAIEHSLAPNMPFQAILEGALAVCGGIYCVRLILLARTASAIQRAELSAT